MGCDGGTIPKRDELVRTKKKPEQVDLAKSRLDEDLTKARLDEDLTIKKKPNKNKTSKCGTIADIGPPHIRLHNNN